MTKIQKILNNLSIQTLIDRYGKDKDRKGFYKCGDENSNSLKIYQDSNRFKCFSCNASGDVIDFIKHEERCDNKTAINIAAKIIGIENISDDSVTVENKIIKPNPELIAKNKKLSSEYCDSCRKTIDYTYLLSRGISKQIQDKCLIGYSLAKKTIVIPYNSKMDYFIARSTTEKSFYKPPSSEMGEEPIWNAAILNTDNVVFVCEGQIDAMSLMEIGFHACAVGGTNGSNKLINFNPKAKIIIAFDNDKVGIEQGGILAKKLNCKLFLPDKFKDWNEYLVNDKDGLINYMKGVK